MHGDHDFAVDGGDGFQLFFNRVAACDELQIACRGRLGSSGNGDDREEE
jgi:hypothetical protein